ncbi:OLC1v1012532C1 [Oldenlandia corymbosa var. corymbosa]|uniref:Probable purine permease n=1 Tax=Oldenlandia corymbosa var. corymbosa TaxID=529605 RepID=A0AAV1DY23_OLDCO|nr:OLC1v1012532C1 [Oldenlandia corymbosa var. corymbosa]
MGTNLLTQNLRLISLVIYSIILAIGNCGGPLILRLYFVKGGQSVWLSSWLQTAGFPILLIPLLASYLHRRQARASRKQLILMDFQIFAGAAFVGTLTGVANYFYGYGVGRLPVSTSSILTATQLGFTAIFAFFIVKQKFHAFSVNAVVLLTVGPLLLGLHANGDRPAGESNKLYVLGFIMMIVAAMLTGIILPTVEKIYKKSKQEITFTLVLEMQFVISFFATLFSTIGMIANHDFQSIPREARAYELGEEKYYLVIFWSAIILQCYFLGSIGVIFCASSLVSAIMIAVLLPVTEILAVFFFNEKFQAEKGVALFLSLWGFVSYFYGEIKHNKKANSLDKELDAAQSQPMSEAVISNNRCSMMESI